MHDLKGDLDHKHGNCQHIIGRAPSKDPFTEVDIEEDIGPILLCRTDVRSTSIRCPLLFE